MEFWIGQFIFEQFLSNSCAILEQCLICFHPPGDISLLLWFSDARGVRVHFLAILRCLIVVARTERGPDSSLLLCQY
jgi:hypothetical protein